MLERNTFRTGIVILVGVLAIAFSWIIEPVIDAGWSRSGDLSYPASPRLREFAAHLAAIGVQVGFLAWIVALLRQQSLMKHTLAESRRQAEVEKATSRSILDAIGDAISIQDRNLRILYQNPAHKGNLGDHTGEFCYRAYQLRDEPCDGCHLLRSFGDGQTHRTEATSKIMPGRHMEIVSTPLRDASGVIVAGIEAVRDITERKEMEETLRKHLAGIEASIDGIAIFNPTAGYRYLNQAHATIYGYDRPTELVGKGWKILYGADEIARFENEIFPTFSAEKKWRGEAVGKKKDGSLFAQEVSLTSVEGDVICVVRDISKRKRAEEEVIRINGELERKADEMEAFSYSLSHDLRSYLTRISTAVQLLKDVHGESLGTKPAELLHTISAAEEGMEELIEAILVLCNVSRGEIWRETVDLSDMATAAFGELQMRSPERRVEVSVEPNLSVRADRNLVKVLLENLAANSWKYTSLTEQPRIEFGRVIEEGEEAFFVRDNGLGFDPDKGEEIFLPFHRLANARSFPGTGVGLATVRRIVERHGGRVSATGTPGKGATIYFTLG